VGGSTVTGGTSETGGIADNGGATDIGGSIDNGGATDIGGSTETGGIADLGGTSAVGGKTSAGGAAGGKGGSLAPGGNTGVAGKTASGGTTGPTGGTTDGAAGAAGAPPPGSIPTGYPTPTADNYAKCTKVAIGTNDACGGQPAGNICIECLFGGTDYNASETSPTAAATSAAGNYVVTVQLGGAAAGDTFVSAESTRGMLQSVATTAGQTLTYAFVVNVRAMEGQPQHAGGPGGYPGLDLFFSGKNPQVTGIGYALATTATQPIMVYIASDSTTCDQSGGAYGGWGQMLPEYFAPPVGIANYANSGASSSSFYGSSNFWGAIKSKWTKGDWAIIQFGHNDKGVADSAVQANLTKYVNDAKAAGVSAILVSPPARVSNVPVGDQSSLHAAAAQAAATAGGVPFIDLTALSSNWYDTVCKTKTVAMTYHANGTDGTHTNLAGGEKLAGLVAQAMKDQNIALAKYLR
jgi:lysophospholipase L1-like esterase